MRERAKKSVPLGEKERRYFKTKADVWERDVRTDPCRVDDPTYETKGIKYERDVGDVDQEVENGGFDVRARFARPGVG